MKEVLKEEVAKAELEKWFELQDAPKELREGPNANILTNALMCGRITIDSSTGDLIQYLKHPFGKEFKITELKYKNAGLSIGKVQEHLSKIALTFEDRNSLAHIVEATGEDTTVLMNLSAKDFNLAKAIIIFFIV